MTKNQLQYWQNVETRRNNIAVEFETNRANLAREAETHRNNVAQLAELQRSNEVKERLAREQFIFDRSKFAVSSNLQAQQLREQERSNKARELENQRHDQQTERLQRSGNYNQRTRNSQDFVISQQGLQNDVRSISERERSNVRQENINMLSTREQIRANRARELENIRSHNMDYNIQQGRLEQSWSSIQETKRANKASEQLKGRDINLRFVTNLSQILGNTLSKIGGSL